MKKNRGKILVEKKKVGEKFSHLQKFNHFSPTFFSPIRYNIFSEDAKWNEKLTFFSLQETQLGFTNSKSTKETPEQCVKYVQSGRRSGVFIVNFEQISHNLFVVSIVDLE